VQAPGATLTEKQSEARERNSSEHGGVFETNSESTKDRENTRPHGAGKGFDALAQIVDRPVTMKDVANDPKIDESVVIDPPTFESDEKHGGNGPNGERSE
jgi:hypothetical protein